MAARSSRRRPFGLELRRLARPVAILLVAALVVVVVAQVSIAGEFRGRLPQVALAVAPYDSEARARLAASLAANSPVDEAREAARDLAHDAIRRDPLTPVALRALGLANSTKDGGLRSEAQALRLFEQSERLSRRDLMTQLWLIEYNLRRGRIPIVMRHFDIALRTSASNRDALFPLLASAAADKRIADELVQRMRDRPHWALPFANHLLGVEVPPQTASFLIRNTLDPRRKDEMAVIEALLHRYAATGQFGAASELYEAFGFPRGSYQNLLNDGSFDAKRGFEPFAWDLTEESDLWAIPESNADGRVVLTLFAADDREGQLARQLVSVRPGRYRLSAVVGNVPQDAYRRQTLSVTCATGDQAQLVSLKPANPGKRMQTMAATFAAPGGCEFQWVAISLAGQDSEESEVPWIDDVALQPAGG